MTTRLLLLGAVALTLAGCGRLGDLQQPPPLFGEAARAEYEASRRGAPDETSPAENEREDRAAPPAPNEEVRPARAPSEFGTPAAPVNVPPAPVAPPPPTPAPGAAPAPGTTTGG